MSETTEKWNEMSASNEKYDRKIMMLPGDVLKFTITVRSPAYLKLSFEDVPLNERIHQEDICYGGVCD